MGYARLQTEPFSVESILDELRDRRAGGVAFYVGTVRGEEEGQPIVALTYEAYPEMAEATLENLRRESIERFALVDAIVVHRAGRLAAGEPILVVAMAGEHRTEAFDALRHFMDRLKEVVPIWKREEGPSGNQWILGPDRRSASS